ncbi:hypothetical protein [Virgibacillus pantothenticus]|uniref:hypothetical protein n=1 Tax=Virgibacillus pantothenticus TaxID=1473 RepID=UPI00067ACE61|nr:hypothetical protein [Virgibacillus pantothenticus]QTY16666.1 hypothetical protein KBP50_01545 [Virgibacillus pantothenticus]
METKEARKKLLERSMDDAKEMGGKIAKEAFDFLIWDDAKTVMDPRATQQEKEIAAASLMPQGKVFKLFKAGEGALKFANKGKQTAKKVKNVTNYRKTFFDKYPELKGSVVVHHAIEQQVLKRYPKLFSKEEIHALSNLRGIPKEFNNDIHLSKIRKEWNRFYRNNPNPTKQDFIDYMIELDRKYGDKFNPRVKR